MVHLAPSETPNIRHFQRLDRERLARWDWLTGQARRNRRISFGTFAVGQALRHMHGRDGHIFPTHQAIAEKAGLSIRAVRYGLRALERLGLLEWTRRAIGRGRQRRQTSSAFRLLLAGLDTLGRLPRLPRQPRALRGCKVCSRKFPSENLNTEYAPEVVAAALAVPVSEPSLEAKRAGTLQRFLAAEAERKAARQASRIGSALLRKG